MKVYLGPYPNHWSTSWLESWWLAKNHNVEWGWEVDEKDYTKLDRAVIKMLDGWQWVLNKTINKIRRKERKEKVRIDYYDIWSMDNTLSLIILPMLKMMKEKKHGAPLVDDKDVPPELRSTAAPKKKNEWDTDANHFKRWDWVLDEMIWVFEQKNDPDGDMKNYYDPYKPNEKTQPSPLANLHQTEEAKAYHEKLQREMGKFNKTKYKKYMQRKQKALMLFGKYFEALWD